MNFNDYQKQAKVYAFPHIEYDHLYMILGLCGEAGEVADKVKKIIRDKKGAYLETDKYGVALELGDILWYISQLARLNGFTLNEIAVMNLEKLEKRKETGKLGGSGDSR